jgi:hypothetical protein
LAGTGFDEADLRDRAGADGADAGVFAERFAGDEVLRADFAGFDFGFVVAIGLFLCVNDSIMGCH